MDSSKNLQRFLIKRFIQTLLIVGIIEYLMLLFINGVMIPTLLPYLFPAEIEIHSTSAIEIIGIVVLLFVLVLLQTVETMIPPIEQFIYWIESGLESWTSSLNARNSLFAYIFQLESWKRWLLFFASVAALVLMVLPFVVAAIQYARLIIREFQKIEDEKEKTRNEYDRQRNLMLSDIAHDLRTPITTISGYAEALSSGMIKEDQQAEYLKAIQNKSVRMNDLITLLFEYVKLDSAGFTLDRENVDLAELLRENAALVYSDIEQNGMELDVDIPEKVIPIEADRLQMSRVITNLLTNSMKHNPRGTKIGLYLKETEDDITVIVSDSGAPIEESIADTIFEPFAKGDKSRSGGGSGLGLSIAKKVITMHGYELTLRQGTDLQKGLMRLYGVEEYQKFPFPKYGKAFIIHIPMN